MEKLYTKEDLEKAYQQGWYACTGWAEREDLKYDVDSTEFLKERDERLAYKFEIFDD